MLLVTGNAVFQFQIAPGGGIHEYTVLWPLYARWFDMWRYLGLGGVHVVQQGAGRGNADIQFVAAKALEIIGAKLLAQALARLSIFEVPRWQSSNGGLDAGLGAEGNVFR